jgi:hypothetical protein
MADGAEVSTLTGDRQKCRGVAPWVRFCQMMHKGSVVQKVVYVCSL